MASETKKPDTKSNENDYENVNDTIDQYNMINTDVKHWRNILDQMGVCNTYKYSLLFSWTVVFYAIIDYNIIDTNKTSQQIANSILFIIFISFHYNSKRAFYLRISLIATHSAWICFHFTVMNKVIMFGLIQAMLVVFNVIAFIFDNYFYANWVIYEGKTNISELFDHEIRIKIKGKEYINDYCKYLIEPSLLKQVHPLLFEISSIDITDQFNDNNNIKYRLINFKENVGCGMLITSKSVLQIISNKDMVDHIYDEITQLTFYVYSYPDTFIKFRYSFECRDNQWHLIQRVKVQSHVLLKRSVLHVAYKTHQKSMNAMREMVEGINQ